MLMSQLVGLGIPFSFLAFVAGGKTQRMIVLMESRKFFKTKIGSRQAAKNTLVPCADDFRTQSSKPI
jgi:hypothetical protein